MKNNFFKIFFVLVFISFAIPQVTLAVWWNPTTWFDKKPVAPKVETMETPPNQSIIKVEEIKKISATSSPTKPVVSQAVKPKTSVFYVKDNINSGIVDENTAVVLNLSFSGKMASEFDISFKLVRDTDNRTLTIETGNNFEYFMKNGGIYKPDLKRLLGPMSYGQTSTTTYHIRVDVTKMVQTPVNSTTVKMEHAVQFSAKSSKFKIVTKPIVKSTISITYPNTQSILQIGKSYDIIWTGSAPELSSYGIYLNNSAYGFNDRTYLGSVNSSQQKFTLKVSQNIVPSLYRIQFLDGDRVFAYSNLFTISN